MARMKIKDLPKNVNISTNEMGRIYGGVKDSFDIYLAPIGNTTEYYMAAATPAPLIASLQDFARPRPHVPVCSSLVEITDDSGQVVIPGGVVCE